jgi:hypothetical protein
VDFHIIKGEINEKHMAHNAEVKMRMYLEIKMLKQPNVLLDGIVQE